MELLMSTEIKKQFKEEIKCCDNSLQIITAFCKLDGLQFIEENIENNLVTKRLMIRCRMEDIIAGATDLKIYEYGKQKEWTIYIRFDLHAKTYIFDKKRCIVGSANLTNSGLQLSGGGNYEMAGIFDVDQNDIGKIDSLFDHAIILNDDLYSQMKQEIASVDYTSRGEHQWSDKIQGLFAPDYSTLFSYDFPEFANYQEYYNQSIDFLGLDSDWDEKQLKSRFELSKVFQWLKNLLYENKGEMYFGAITVCLHNVLVKDPKPYRKEVKELLARLLQWVQDLELESILVDRPNHSQRVRLRE